MSTQALWLVTVSLQGKSLGIWRTAGDFEISGDSTKVLQAGGGFKTYGARANYGTLEVTRIFDIPEVDDFWPFVQREVKHGVLVVTRTALEDEFTASTRAPRRYSGQLMSAVEGGTDITVNDPRIATLTCDVTSIG